MIFLGDVMNMCYFFIGGGMIVVFNDVVIFFEFFYFFCVLDFEDFCVINVVMDIFYWCCKSFINIINFFV